MPDSYTDLTLGVVHRILRGQVGSDGWVRVSIAFEQHTTISPVRDAEYESTVFSRRFFKATMDFSHDDLIVAELQSGTLGNESEHRVKVMRQEDRYVYSIDESAYGRFAGDPDIFQVSAFETRLEEIPVKNLTIAQVRDHTEDVVVDSFDVELDNQGFVDLVRVFGDAVTASEGHELDTFTVHLTAGGDLLFDYWWKTLEEDKGSDAEKFDCYVACHVTIRLAQASPVTVAPVAVDESLPVVESVDSIWALIRNSV